MDAHGSSFGEDQTHLALEGIAEGGALRLEVVVRDVGLRCHHTSHAQDAPRPHDAREGREAE